MGLKINDTITADANGKILTGIVLKLNPTKCKIKCTGGTTRFAIGTTVCVPYGLITAPFRCGPYGEENTNTVPARSMFDSLQHNAAKPLNVPKPFEATTWWVQSNIHGLMMLSGIFNRLSPENLACDGEASATQIRHRHAELMREKAHIDALLGVSLDETQYYDIMGKFKETISKSLIQDGENVLKWH